MSNSPVDHLRRAARSPVVTPGAAGSAPVAKFAEGGATEETPEARAARLLLERRREEEDLRDTIPPEPGLPPRPAQPTAQRPAATPAAAAELPTGRPVDYQPNLPASPLLSQLRERLTESAVPSQGENFRQQLMALGAGMAGSQSRHFAGALSEGVRAMQAQEQQQQTHQRQLLETEATARYREAVVELQRAEQAAARDPNDPRNIERLAHARYYMAQAAAAGARGGGGAGERLGTGTMMRTRDGSYVMAYPSARGGVEYRPMDPNLVPVSQERAMAGAPFIHEGLVYQRSVSGEPFPLTINGRQVTAEQYTSMRTLENIDSAVERAGRNAVESWRQANNARLQMAVTPAAANQLTREMEAARIAGETAARNRLLRPNITGASPAEAGTPAAAGRPRVATSMDPRAQTE